MLNKKNMNEIIDFLWFNGDYIAANPMLLPAIASGVASLFGTFATNRANKKRQEEMNEYNSPAAQLERYKKAGVNAGYGQGLSAGNQSSFPSAVAPDVSAAIEPAAKFMSMKLQNQSLKNAQLENNRLAELVRTQSLNNDFLEQTLENRVQSTKLSNILSGARISTAEQMLPLNIEKMLFSNRMLSTQMNYLSYEKKASLDLLKKRGVIASIEAALKQQMFNFRQNMNPLQYQLSQQQFVQRELTNPLEYAISLIKAAGLNANDPLMLRMIAPSVLQGESMSSNPLYPYAIPFSTGKSLLDVLKLGK